ncbi:MAG TPA: serine hydrolase [Mucilaginibacter sp.]|nr:serine hydrolase [Mucilaginibacter sp.]
MKYSVLFFLFFICPNQTYSQGNSALVQARLDSVYAKVLNVYELPGFAVGIIKGGKVTYAQGFGVNELGKPGAIDANSSFHMASVSKPFTATAIMQLANRDKIKLDSPLTTYIRYFKMKDSRYKKVTIRQMLTHTSGFPDVKDYGWNKPQYDDKALERYIKDSVANNELLFEPGSDFSYSNMAYDVLAEVIKQVSGMPFETYMDKYIFKPCKMDNSTFLVKAVLPDIATAPHVFGVNCKFQVSAIYPYNRCHAASSTLHSTINDMLIWASLILNNGKLYGKQIINSESLKMMLSTQYKFDQESSMGLGWFLDTRNGKQVIGHGGSDVGYASNISIIPQDSVAVVVMGNLFSFVPDGGIKELAFNAVYNLADWKLKKPVNLVIAPLMCKESFSKAKEKYFELKNNNSDDYDFNEEWLDKLGYAFVNEGKLQDAISVLQLNAEAFPKSVNCYDSLGEIYAMNGQKERAKEAFKTALKLDPNCERCLRKLKKIGND